MSNLSVYLITNLRVSSTLRIHLRMSIILMVEWLKNWDFIHLENMRKPTAFI